MKAKKLNDKHIDFCIDEVRRERGYGGNSEHRMKNTFSSRKAFIIKMIRIWSKKFDDKNASKWDLPYATNTFNDGREKHYVMFLDIDSPEYLPLAIRHIETVFECKYAVVESSPNKYWVLVDYSTKDPSYLKEVIETVPGHDERWLRISPKVLYLRAYMKGVPNFNEASIPKFPEDGAKDWEDPIAKKWYNAFEDYWANDFIYLRDAIDAHRAVRDGEVGKLIANPKFKVGT